MGGGVKLVNIHCSKYYHDMVRDYVAMHLGAVYEDVQTEVKIPRAGATGIRDGSADIVADNKYVWEIKTVRYGRSRARRQLARYTSKLEGGGFPGEPVVPYLPSDTIETAEGKIVTIYDDVEPGIIRYSVTEP